MKTQFGFRKGKGTSHAIAALRRLQDMVERTGRPGYLVLLDWEKAFDRVRQDKLVEALGRLGVSQKLGNVIASLYAQPQFAVELNGKSSEWKIQQRGIRQGCPLSPYLFIVLMTVMFEDVYADFKKLRTHGSFDGVPFWELLYADDTILVGKNTKDLQKYLQKIEEHAEYYGLQLNKAKCCMIRMNGRGWIKFRNETRVKIVSEAQYLGVTISARVDIREEVRQRIRVARVTWRRLSSFWIHSGCSVKLKNYIYDAVIRARLTYGLESAF